MKVEPNFLFLVLDMLRMFPVSDHEHRVPDLLQLLLRQLDRGHVSGVRRHVAAVRGHVARGRVAHVLRVHGACAVAPHGERVHVLGVDVAAQHLSLLDMTVHERLLGIKH